jgi:hypothetical protein
MRSLRALIGAECVERILVTDLWEFWVDEDGWLPERESTRRPRALLALSARGSASAERLSSQGWATLRPDLSDVGHISLAGCAAVHPVRRIGR